MYGYGEMWRWLSDRVYDDSVFRKKVITMKDTQKNRLLNIAI